MRWTGVLTRRRGGRLGVGIYVPDLLRIAAEVVAAVVVTGVAVGWTVLECWAAVVRWGPAAGAARLGSDDDPAVDVPPARRRPEADPVPVPLTERELKDPAVALGPRPGRDGAPLARVEVDAPRCGAGA
ncbi:MAG TPA: hypothetical protein VFN55_07700 [Solirubrobacteraceae bacterium]|nr:hypothetical protein [Solirubrobacteraceae bacterium]